MIVMMDLDKRIDVHGHYFPPAYKQLLDRHGIKKPDGFPMPTWSEEQQYKEMDQLNITYSILSISSPHLHFGDSKEAIETAYASNEYGAELVKRSNGKLGFLASLPLPEIDASITEIRHSRSLGAKGFALQTNSCGVYLGSPKLDDVMEELNKEETVIAIHPTMPSAVPQNVSEELPYPLMEFFFDTTRTITNMILKGALKKFPNIKFIIPHAGAFLPILSDRIASFAQVVENTDEDQIDIFGDLRKFYYDLSGFSMPKQYDVLCKIAEKENLLYGSDGPFTPLAARIQLAEQMDSKLEAEIKDMIYLNNAKKLFKK
ncbi:MAG: amidohydrolase [Clostridiales bacterium]|nr:amidohydrolase [Clostridiales bacterium]